MPESVYERVMNDPTSRQSYLGTTRGILSAAPDQDETQRVRDILNEHSVAHLFNADRTVGVPCFSEPHGLISIGFEEIAARANLLQR